MRFCKTFTRGPSLLLIILVIAGCSSGHAIMPEPSTPLINEPSAAIDTNHILWGAWNIGFDPATNELSVTSRTSASPHYDVTLSLLPPDCTECVKVTFNSFDPVTRLLDVDVTLKNPSNITGRDVRGILVIKNSPQHLLVNEDGWTAKFDPIGGSDKNPFKAYAKGEPNRVFAPGASHTENFVILMPTPMQYSEIAYIVSACAPGNCPEPYEIVNYSQTPFISATGAKTTISVDVNDWQDNVNNVLINAGDINGMGTTPMTHQTGTTWAVSLTNKYDQPAGDYEVFIYALSANSGSLAMYKKVVIEIIEAPGYAKSWGGSDWDKVHDIAVDQWGSTIVVGEFAGSVDFDPGDGETILTANGGVDAFACKFDPAGNLVNAYSWGSTGTDIAWDICIDLGGLYYIVGEFSLDVDFNPGAGSEIHSSNGGTDAFISYFNIDFNWTWTKTWGSSSQDGATGVMSLSPWYTYITGYFGYITDFDPGPGEFIGDSLGGTDCFLLNLTPVIGDFVWVKTWGGGGLDRPNAVFADINHRPFVAGHFSLSADFDPGPGVDTHNSNGGYDAFIVNFLDDGSYLWAGTWGSTNEDEALDVVVDENTGYPYVTGYYYGEVDLDPTTGVDTHTAVGAWDSFLSSFENNGDFRWALNWGGTGEDHGKAITIDEEQNILVAGLFKDTVDFDPGGGVLELISNGNTDAYLTKIDTDGNFLWARAWGGPGADASIGVDEYDSEPYVCGYFSDIADLDPTTGVDERESSGGWDMFFIRILPSGEW